MNPCFRSSLSPVAISSIPPNTQLLSIISQLSYAYSPLAADRTPLYVILEKNRKESIGKILARRNKSLHIRPNDIIFRTKYGFFTI